MKNKTQLTLEDFKCIQCHACCRETGYVRLQADEPDAIAKFLDMQIHEFIETYTRLTRDRQCLSLIEQPDGACIFLTQEGCSIQAVKPVQCKNFPHKWKFSDFEQICGWAKKVRALQIKALQTDKSGQSDHKPKMPSPSSSSK